MLISREIRAQAFQLPVRLWSQLELFGARLENLNTNNLFFAVVILAFLIRLVSVFSVVPGNAPDEYGHMVMATGLANMKLYTLSEALKISAYPYAIYNPAGYLPGSLLLSLASLLNPTVHTLLVQNSFTDDALNLIIRFGNLVWVFFFILFLVKLVRSLDLRIPLVALITLGFLPQMTFVQSYANTDNIGIFAVTYLFWALHARRLNHIAFATFVVMNCKLTSFSVLPMPFLMFCIWYSNNLKELVSKGLLYLGLPFFLGCSWFLWNYHANTGIYGSFLGFDVLGQIMNGSAPAGAPAWDAALKKEFFMTSIGSTYGHFGYMNQPMPEKFMRSWLYLYEFGVVATAIRFVCALLPWVSWTRHQRAWTIGLTSVFVVNWCLHVYSTSMGGYQPQGRYLFPSTLVVLLSLVYSIQYMYNRVLILGQAFALGICSFLLLSAGWGIYASHFDPYSMGFNSPKPILEQAETSALIRTFFRDTLAEQSFIAPGDASILMLRLANYGKKDYARDCIVEFRVLDQYRKEIHSTEPVPCEKTDGDWLRFRLPEGKNAIVAQNMYFFSIKLQSSAANDFVAIYRSAKDAYLQGDAYMIGAKMPYDFAFRLIGKGKNLLPWHQ